jgi:threonine dehydrogenase-like Zn-dependent dehydrogenase
MSSKGKADVHTAAVLHGALDLRIEPRPLVSDPAKDIPFGFAQVKIVATTLCGSDCKLRLFACLFFFQVAIVVRL